MIRRLGILGGTFDPPHSGHLGAALEALHQLALDRVLWVPAGAPPHKPSQPITPGHHRLVMLERAMAGNPHLSISTVDLERPGPCYTVDTLALLRAEYGHQPEFYFIEGADSLADLPTWYRPQRLLDLCRFAVVHRPGVEIDLAALEERLPGLGARVHFVEMPLLEISSTDLRRRVRQGRPISYLVHPGVEAYIQEQGLYR